jgi:hypothetical protein
MNRAKIIEQEWNAVVHGVDGCVSIHFFTPTQCVAAAHVSLELEFNVWWIVTRSGCEKAEYQAGRLGGYVTKVIIMAPYPPAARTTFSYVHSQLPNASIILQVYDTNLDDGVNYSFIAYRGTTDVITTLS